MELHRIVEALNLWEAGKVSKQKVLKYIHQFFIS